MYAYIFVCFVAVLPLGFIFCFEQLIVILQTTILSLDNLMGKNADNQKFIHYLHKFILFHLPIKVTINNNFLQWVG